MVLAISVELHLLVRFLFAFLCRKLTSRGHSSANVSTCRDTIKNLPYGRLLFARMRQCSCMSNAEEYRLLKITGPFFESTCMHAYVCCVFRLAFRCRLSAVSLVVCDVEISSIQQCSFSKYIVDIHRSCIV
jgi:hypothetical protein